MIDSLDKDLMELAEVGVLDGLEVTKQFVENLLNVTLIDFTKYYSWSRFCKTLKAFTVTDPATEGSTVLVLLINFSSSTCSEPISFCFMNARTGWLVSNPTNPDWKKVKVVDSMGGHDKHFEPFYDLTREAYLAEAKNGAKPKNTL